MKLDRIIAVRNSKTVYHDGENCIKVFDADFSKADVLNEALNHARVEETGLAVPKIKEVTVIDGRWAIIQEFIKGKTLARLMQEQPGEAAAYLERFVDLQLEIQAKTCPKLSRLRDKLSAKIDQTGLDATTRYGLHTRLEAMPTHNKLCHGDFNPTNVIVTDGGALYTIDWSHATQGNASADAARTYLLFWLAGDIDGAERYLDLFCKRSDTAKQYVQKWMPIVAAAQSVIGNEKERQFLLSWADVADDQQ